MLSKPLRHRGAADAKFQNITPVNGHAVEAEEYMLTALTLVYTGNHAKVNVPDLTEMPTKTMGSIDDGERLKELQDALRSVAEKLYFVMGIPSGNQYVLTHLLPRGGWG